ncbi:MAG: hypothetical protein K2I06_05220 [Ruminococcus sp.]|nr:hypothetical protein [Ruminococcus sp.]
MNYIENIFRKTAEEDNTTVENVQKEIIFAIETAMKNTSPNNLKTLKSMSATGETPTPEELIIYLCNNIVFPE